MWLAAGNLERAWIREVEEWKIQTRNSAAQIGFSRLSRCPTTTSCLSFCFK